MVRRLVGWIACVVVALSGEVVLAADGALSVEVGLRDANLPSRLHALPTGGRAVVADVPGATGKAARLTLERFEVFAPDAAVILKDDTGERRLPPPAAVFFRGSVVGDAGSTAFVSMDENGQLRGIVHQAGEIRVFERDALNATATVKSRAVDRETDFAERTFNCDTADLPEQGSVPLSVESVTPKAIVARSTTPYVARIAIETDYEFFQKFGSTGKATQYIGDLLGYVSTIYSAELQTQLQVGDIYLYGTSADPWSATTTSTALTEIGNYWEANRSSVVRTVTQFISGKNVGGGIAWVNALCDKTYGYSVAMGLSGSFSAANPQVIWDSVVVAHEMGHNFGSPHTHNYDNIGGVSNPVDCCYASTVTTQVCYTAALNYPGIGSLSGGTAGGHNGTIMSYCHLRTGGFSNMAYTFGKNHPYGVSAGRVPTVMRGTVESAAARYPSCLTVGTADHFSDIAGNWAAAYINAIAAAGITTGCGGGKYCPNQVVDRQSMAALVVRAKEGEAYATTCSTPPFSDVPTSNAFCKYIKRVSALGISTGCGGGNYCPTQSVTRDQMAAFIVRAVEGEPAATTCNAGSGYADVSISNGFCKYIKRLTALGVTTGCGGGNYCPSQAVTRDQIAAFLARAFLGM
jgi:hypothetical protein